jgi:hypothetical protein
MPDLCAAENVTQPSADARLERGQAIVAEATGLLSSNLMQAISASGISNALPYCSVAAAPLTSLVATNRGVALQRVSHKIRNPKNRASTLELKLLESYRAQLREGQKSPRPTLITNAANGVSYYAPIVIANPLCLNCHGVPGTDIQRANHEIIKRLYPQDEATGFKFGDLRGLWRVDFRD